MSANALTLDYIDVKSKHEFHIPVFAFKRPRNNKEYSIIESYLDELIDETRNDENHPLAQAMLIIGENLEEYDNSKYSEIGTDVTNIEMVKYLMKKNNLAQKDLIDIFGNQGNVSKFLSGERALSKSQIMGLKDRFGIGTDFFLRN
jgi:HTH-type transcriptional regulator / antitoxin HigA